MSDMTRRTFEHSKKPETEYRRRGRVTQKAVLAVEHLCMLAEREWDGNPALAEELWSIAEGLEKAMERQEVNR